MLFWILVATLTAAVAVVLILPLLRAATPASSPHSHDIEVYRDQLDELTRDQESGLINGDDAELARAEVARRLLAAGEIDRAAVPVATTRRGLSFLAQAFVLFCLPAIGLCLYLFTGSPGVPAQPLAARLAAPGSDINILIARAENHLAQNPNDGAGWEVLAPIYMRNGRVEEAVAAYDNAVRLLGPTPARLGGYAEALIALSDGLVTTEAQSALRRSLAIDPSDPRSEYYLALGLKQEGKKDEALAAFNRLIAGSPADAPWVPLVKQHVADLSGGASGNVAGAAPGNPSADDIAAAQDMNAGDRQEMIRGMVESLASRLKEDPANPEGWARLIRSHVVLDQRDQAAAALRESQKTFPADGEQGKQLLALARELGIKTDGETQ